MIHSGTGTISLKSSNVEYTSDNVCGSCSAPERVNYSTPHLQVYTQPGKGVDMDTDFEDWEDYSLKNRYDLVEEFDATVDECISVFKALVDSCKVVEKEIMVPKTIRVIECAGVEA
ncbi:hypothetical protein METP2_00762 [Methanosarcinales archaeon]|nr:hypothetical protein METP2_00762 [Methanosarcinales archaeon]